MRPLTANQERVLAFIRQFIDEKGFAPTQAEIAAGLGYRSANAAAEHLRLLAKKGAVSLTPGLARSIRIVEREFTAAEGELPVVGEVAAGSPILAEENVETTLSVPARLFRPKADYLLRVRGTSMIERGICNRDLVAVSRTSRVKNGDIAVVRLGEDVTVKTWRKLKNRIILEPANAELDDIVVDPKKEEVHVEGRVVGLLRLGLEKHR